MSTQLFTTPPQSNRGTKIFTHFKLPQLVLFYLLILSWSTCDHTVFMGALANLSQPDLAFTELITMVLYIS